MSDIPVFFDIETTGFNPCAQNWQPGVQYDAEVTAVGIGWIPNFDTAMGPEDAEFQSKILTSMQGETRLLNNLKQEMVDLVMDLESWSDPEDVDRSIAEMQWNKGTNHQIFLTGFNSVDFDHVYLCGRYAQYELSPWPFCYRRPRLDLSEVMNEVHGHYQSQDDWLDHYGYPTDDDYTGSEMPDARANCEWGKIIDHCKSDIEDLMRLFMCEVDQIMDGDSIRRDIGGGGDTPEVDL